MDAHDKAALYLQVAGLALQFIGFIFSRAARCIRADEQARVRMQIRSEIWVGIGCLLVIFGGFYHFAGGAR